MLHLFGSVLDLIHTAFFSIVLTVALAVPILLRSNLAYLDYTTSRGEGEELYMVCCAYVCSLHCPAHE